MKSNNRKERYYVLSYYRPKALNTQKALSIVLARAGMKPNRRFRMRWAAAIILAFIAGAAMLWPGKVTLVAGNQPRTINIDGTHITLAPYASVAYRRNDPRKVDINGRAFFDIRHDARHPFSIVDKRYVIRDIGTRLQVDETSGRTKVMVLQGCVDFASKAEASAPLRLNAGHAAVLTVGSNRPEPCNESPNAAAWATHQLHFDNTPLAEVVSDLEMYYHVKLCYQPSDKRLTGDFGTDSLRQVLEIINLTLHTDIAPTGK